MPPPSQPNVMVENYPFLATNAQTESEQPNPTTNKRAKGPFETIFQNESGHIADRSVGRALYANGLSFNLVRSPYWRDMIRKVNEVPKGYKDPGYEKVHRILLEREVKMVEDYLQPIRDSWIETSVSIVSNGWKDAKIGL